MKYLIIILLLTGCSKPIDMAIKSKKADYRREVFLECMKASETQSNGVTSTVESEVSNLVDSSNLVSQKF